MDAVMNWLWQGTVVAIAASLVLIAMRRTPASARYGVCWGACLMVFALPFIPLVPATLPAAGAIVPSQAEAVVQLPKAWWTSTLVIGVAWLLWTVIQLARFVSAIVAIRRARARSRPFPADLESALPHWRRISREGRHATLVVSDAVTTAAVLGWGSPLIAVAPSLARTLRPEDLDRVLVHEWAHVQRRDDLANILQVVIRSVAGWHPALWWTDRRLRAEREIACDEMAVAITGSPKSYAECLMKLSSVTTTPMAMLTAPVAQKPGLRARLLKIVSPRPRLAAPWSHGLAAVSVLMLGAISVVVGGRTLVDAAAHTAPAGAARDRALDVTLPRPAAARPVAADSTSANARDTGAPGGRPEPARAARERAARNAQPPSQGQPASPRPAEAISAVAPLPSAVAGEPPAPPPPHVPATMVSESPVVAGPDALPATPVTAIVTSVPPTPAALPGVGAPDPRSPWSTAAAGGVAVGRTSQDAGVAIGRTSKDAGVATAGFFTRIARRVAGSF